MGPLAEETSPRTSFPLYPNNRTQYLPAAISGARTGPEQCSSGYPKCAASRAPRPLLQHVALVLEHSAGEVVEGGGDRARLQPVVVRFTRERGIDRFDRAA